MAFSGVESGKCAPLIEYGRGAQIVIGKTARVSINNSFSGLLRGFSFN